MRRTPSSCIGLLTMLCNRAPCWDQHTDRLRHLCSIKSRLEDGMASDSFQHGGREVKAPSISTNHCCLSVSPPPPSCTLHFQLTPERASETQYITQSEAPNATPQTTPASLLRLYSTLLSSLLFSSPICEAIRAARLRSQTLSPADRR